MEENNAWCSFAVSRKMYRLGCNLAVRDIEAPDCRDRLSDVAAENTADLLEELLIIERQGSEILLIVMRYGENTRWAQRTFFHRPKDTHFTLG